MTELDVPYVCPNGHAFPGHVAVACQDDEHCMATVACVPLAAVREIGEDADSAANQAAFWRARAIVLGADPDEWSAAHQRMQASE